MTGVLGQADGSNVGAVRLFYIPVNLTVTQRAIDLHQQSLEIAREIGDRGGEASSLSNLGDAYNSLGQYQRAIDFHQQFLEIAREIGDREGEARSLWNLTQVFQQRGRIRLAMHYRHQAYQVWQDINLPIAAAPLPDCTKNLIQRMGDNWVEQMIAGERAMVSLVAPIGYLLFALRLFLFPLTQLQTRLKIPPKIFWLCVGLAIAFLI